MALNLGSLLGTTPQGAAAQGAAMIAGEIGKSTTSASGDITTGAKTFGGINSGFQVPAWVWGAGVALVALVVLAGMRRK